MQVCVGFSNYARFQAIVVIVESVLIEWNELIAFITEHMVRSGHKGVEQSQEAPNIRVFQECLQGHVTMKSTEVLCDQHAYFSVG
jgi:hypothetical protein